MDRYLISAAIFILVFGIGELFKILLIIKACFFPIALATADAVKNIPFFVGIAHLGYHVFPRSYGQIIEGHSTRQLNDPQALETSPFNPLVKGGGPRGGPYKSGLIAIPPGYL